MKGRTAFIVAGVLALAAFGLHFVFGGERHTVPIIPTATTTPAATSTTSAPMPTSSAFTLTSPAFTDGGAIPAKYTCDGPPAGGGTSPALSWSNVPAGTKSLVLIVEDPDVPKALLPSGLFVHWVLYGIPAEAKGVAEGGPPAGGVGNPGENGAGKAAYAPPCPPREYEPSEHRYIFTLYALDTAAPQFIKVPTENNVMGFVEGHTLAKATYTGRYKRQ